MLGPLLESGAGVTVRSPSRRAWDEFVVLAGRVAAGVVASGVLAVDDLAAVVVDGRGVVTAVVNGRGVVTAPVVVCDGFPGVVGAGCT